ncbi:MAG: hypothetical protein NXH89_02725 [Cyclobacteriaceae bacterium]|nr:hypothetical protein [Cyclobacteriaceae bacterium]
MNKKKILIVSSTFHPVQSPRSLRVTELAKELSRQGHSVSVLTPSGDETNHFCQLHSIELLDLGKNNFREIRIASNNSLLFFLERMVFRILNLFFEYPDIGYYFLVKSKLKKLRGFDLLISNAVPFPIHWGVASVWKVKRIAKSWIADCGDPYMGSVNDTFPKMFYFHYFENNFLSRANFISVPFNDLKYKFNKKYHDKFKVIPQGFNFEDVVLDEYSKNSILTIAYVGTVIPGHRHPFELIQYLDNLKVKYQFIFFGTTRDTVSKQIKINKNLIFRAKMDRIKLIVEISKMDFLVNVMERKINDKITAIPSKLIDYQLSNRPILNYEYGAFKPEILDEFLLGNYSNSFFIDNFDDYKIENVAFKFLKIIES